LLIEVIVECGDCGLIVDCRLPIARVEAIGNRRRSAIRNPQSRQSAIRNPQSRQISYPQSAIASIRNPQSPISNS
jgi:hypothetical protein